MKKSNKRIGGVYSKGFKEGLLLQLLQRVLQLLLRCSSNNQLR